MIIEYNKFYENKTKSFLYPTLKYHGEIFKTKFNSTFKLAVGIHDYNIEDTFSYAKCKIYILFDSLFNKKAFDDFIKYVKFEPYYVYDYIFGDNPKNTRMRMLVIELPKEMVESYYYFLEGLYSRMFSQKQLLSLFHRNSKEFKVLMNESEMKKNMIKKIQKEFEIYEDISIIPMESELPLKNKEEIFNYKGNDYFFNINNNYGIL